MEKLKGTQGETHKDVMEETPSETDRGKQGGKQPEGKLRADSVLENLSTNYMEPKRKAHRQTDLPDRGEGKGGKVGRKKTGLQEGGRKENDKGREGGKCGAGGGSQAREGMYICFMILFHCT